MTSPASDDAAEPDDTLDPLTEQALEWQVRLNSGEDRAAVERAFELWKNADPSHRQAADRAAELWRLLGGALPRRVRGPPKTVIVFLICGLAAGGFFAGGAFGPPRSWLADARTAVGERRDMVLPDGTRVDLDGGTSFDIAFTADRRQLRLYTGRIHVAVQPDKARPFEVVADGGSARALGTAFDVGIDGVRTSVLVTENVVRVRAVAEQDAEAVDLFAGQEVSYADQKIGAIRQADPRARTAWRQGRLVFDGQPLGEVAAVLSRYRRGRILVTDRSLEALRLTGTFSTADSDRMLDAIETALPVRILRLPLLTLIRPDTTRIGKTGAGRSSP
ncbi:FecR domain-containing protein [Methylorubrum podarium]|jgi:transmembrane sensor|uniref:FecR domain-containing protein n=1 Tax=Methylorubrum podarium TaxID=200476 RepID=A0ABV1QG47_9HYPH